MATYDARVLDMDITYEELIVYIVWYLKFGLHED